MAPLWRIPRLRLRLLQPERHAHLAVHRRRCPEMNVLGSMVSPAAMKLREAGMTMRDHRAQTELSGERQRIVVMLYGMSVYERLIDQRPHPVEVRCELRRGLHQQDSEQLLLRVHPEDASRRPDPTEVSD